MTEIETALIKLTRTFNETLKASVSRERQKTVAAQAKVANWRQRAQAYRRELVALRKAQKS